MDMDLNPFQFSITAEGKGFAIEVSHEKRRCRNELGIGAFEREANREILNVGSP